MASTQAHASCQYCQLSLLFRGHFCISVAFNLLPGMEGDTGNVTGGMLQGRQRTFCPILATAVDGRHVSHMSAMIAAHWEEEGGGAKAPSPQPTRHPLSTTFPRFSSHRAMRLSVTSDVDVSDVCRGAGQVHVLVHAFGFRGVAMQLSLPQAGLQQRLNLLLTRPQAVRVAADDLR